MSVPDLLEVVTDSLRGIDPQDPYRIQVHIPNGFEYVNDEMAADVGLAIGCVP